MERQSGQTKGIESLPTKVSPIHIGTDTKVSIDQQSAGMTIIATPTDASDSSGLKRSDELAILNLLSYLGRYEYGLVARVDRQMGDVGKLTLAAVIIFITPFIYSY